MSTHEREITAPVDLCRPGHRPRLASEAVGWSRRPLHRANLSGWGRTKRWEYWGLVTATHVVALTVSNLDYAGVHSIYVLDRESGAETVRDATVPLARGATFSDRSGVGSATTGPGRLRIDFVDEFRGTRMSATAPGLQVEAYAARPRGHESLGVVVPWSDQLFQYTVKDVARPLTGRLHLDGIDHDMAGWAVLDHGRGRWPYSLTWNWAAGSGTVDGSVRGIQLGGKWTDGTGSTENALLVDGRLHKIGQELNWEYDPDDWMRPWRISGDELELTLEPFHVRSADTNLLVVGSRARQAFGEWHGWGMTDDGERVRFDGLVGWAEEVHNRW